MNIFVPFTSLRAETWNALWPVFGATFVPLTDPSAYSRYFIRRWKEGRTFINVEHDVEPTVGQLQEIWDCPHPWCGFGYTPADTSAYLGCVKFSAAFIKAHPDLWVERPWGNCDVYLADRATMPYHFHYPPVRHIK